MAAVGGARERPVGTRVGVVAASSDVIRLLHNKIEAYVVDFLHRRDA
jgi:hypothetical protein